MKIERTKNASRNIAFGMALKLYQIIMPFIMRTVMIYFMGVQYLGLSSLFSSILQVLNLVELGVGNALVFSMYKPIVEDNTEKICALMKLYRKYYRVIGLVIAAIGLVLTPFVPYLVKNDLPDGLNIYVLYLMNLGATVLSYWLFAYKNSLFQAHQRIDVVSKITICTNTFLYIAQLFVIIFVKNYYWYVIAILITQVLTNISTAIAADRKYPKYKPKGVLTKEEVKKITKRIRDLFTSKIGFVIVNSADTIVISAFLGLTVLAVYQNYYFIITSVIAVITIIFQSCTAGIGNSLIVETKEKNFKDLKKFTFLISWISCFCASCFLCLFQPFMELWVGKELKLAYSAVICFAIYFYVYEINQLLNTYKDSAGMWHEDRFRPLVTAFSNLGMNLIMVQFWGIYGVLLSTVLSTLFVGMPWLLHNLFTVIFDKKMLIPYLKLLLLTTFVSLIFCGITCLVASLVHLSLIWTIIIRVLICCFIPNILFFVIFRKKIEFKDSIKLIDNITKHKIKILQRFSN